jgi:hypothetical protein
MHSTPHDGNGVNAGILAARDHKTGDPERPDWCDLDTGADVRLMAVNQPSAYLELPGKQRAAIQEWVAQELVTAPLAGPRCSYGLKHVFHRLPGGFYVTNGQFKGAMLAAGHEPIDRYELNWRFSYLLADPQLFDRSLGRIA